MLPFCSIRIQPVKAQQFMVIQKLVADVIENKIIVLGIKVITFSKNGFGQVAFRSARAWNGYIHIIVKTLL